MVPLFSCLNVEFSTNTLCRGNTSVKQNTFCPYHVSYYVYFAYTNLKKNTHTTCTMSHLTKLAQKIIKKI